MIKLLTETKTNKSVYIKSAGRNIQFLPFFAQILTLGKKSLKSLMVSMKAIITRL